MVIMAPSLAGILAAASWDFIFIAGGLLYLVSLIMFLLFFKERDTGAIERVSEIDYS